MTLSLVKEMKVHFKHIICIIIQLQHEIISLFNYINLCYEASSGCSKQQTDDVAHCKTQRNMACQVNYLIHRLAARKNFTTKITMSLSTAVPLRIKPNSGYPNQPAHLSNLIRSSADRSETKGPYKTQSRPSKAALT